MINFKNIINSSRILQFCKVHKIEQRRSVKRWVAPTLRELQSRRKKLGPEAPTPRSSYLDWNYDAELYAFGKRLHEEFDLKKLQNAFVQRSFVVQEELKQKNVGIENPISLNDNSSLTKKGESLISDYVQGYLKYSLPKVPQDGITAIHNYLTSQELLAHISSHLGINDLVLSAEFPVPESVLRDTLAAVIGALEESSGKVRAFTFVRDFICTQLNDKDLMEIWEIHRPLERLESYCRENKMEKPEPRLIGEAAKNTVLATYNVGIYSNKILIGKGFGETVNIAVEMAAIEALRTFYGISEQMRPLDFTVKVEEVSEHKNQLMQ